MVRVIRICLIALLSFFSYSTFASHIVGGEIQFYRLDATSSRYYLGLNLYFDAANGRPAAETQTIKLYIFKKADNSSLGFVEIPQTVKKNINYTNPNCTVNTDLSTYFISYGSEVVFNTSNFADPQGYYIVWERCCRNNIVTNIINPASTGATFYLAFPALVQNNQLYINSSPRFGELTGDYICRNRPFTFDFSGKDTDGDSLVYSLVKPFAGFSGTSNAEPVATGATNYPEITWAAGISDQNMIPGPRPLRIDQKTGQLTTTASQLGLYVFAVLVEEYRKGKRIGIVRREFQFKVVDCPSNAPPQALYKETGKKEFYKKGEILTIKRGQTKCLDILITDIDPSQRLKITTKAINFGDNTVSISPNIYTTKSSKDTLKAQICFDKCVESRNNQPVIVEIIVQDDGCPQPLYDTLQVRILIEPNSYAKPKATTDLPNSQATVNQGATLNFKVTGLIDADDDIILEARGRGFQLAQVGMLFNNATGKKTVTQPFSWTPPCTASDREYVVDFIVTNTTCSSQIRDTVTVRLKANPRPNQAPKVTSSLGLNQTVEVTGGQVVTFDVYADDIDKDRLSLVGEGRGFDFRQYKMSFEDKTGVPKLSSRFEWKPDCPTLEKLSGQTLKLNFIADDNGCGAIHTDTLIVQLKIQDYSIQNLDNIIITNVITPNNDGKNDCFMANVGIANVCEPRFERVEIVNRWGKLLYQSTDQQFRWCAEDAPSGEYFYGLHFTNRTIKGIVTVLK
jgi:gliding motility-associated-like protein